MFPLLGKNKTDKLLYLDTWIALFNPGMKEEAQVYFSNCAIFMSLKDSLFLEHIYLQILLDKLYKLHNPGFSYTDVWCSAT